MVDAAPAAPVKAAAAPIANAAGKPISCPANVTELGCRWQAAQTGSVGLLWRFSKALLKFVENNPKIQQKEIGAACAEAANRRDENGTLKPYSPSWVSRALKCARSFPSEPTGNQIQQFDDMFHGNGAPKASKSASESTAEDAIRGAISFAKGAVKRGMDIQTALDRIAEALTATDEETDEAGE